MRQKVALAIVFSMMMVTVGCSEQSPNSITVLEYLNSGFDENYENMFFNSRDTDKDKPPRIEILLKLLKYNDFDFENYFYSSRCNSEIWVGEWRGDQLVVIRSHQKPSSMIPSPQEKRVYCRDLNGRVIARKVSDFDVKFNDGTLHRSPTFDDTRAFFTVVTQNEPYDINLYKVSDPNTIIGRVEVPPFRRIFRDKERLYLISSGSFKSKAAFCEIVDVSGDKGRSVEIIKIPFPYVWAASGLVPRDVDMENQLILFRLRHNNYLTSRPQYIFDLKTRKLTKCSNGRNSDGIFLKRDFFDCLFKTLDLPNKKLSEISHDDSSSRVD